ncbi:MAG: uracil-DNA glycosylase [Spirochaetia bacterium]|nr:uracil-DNA glycosylase [Spirochaetia bacterium]
MKESCEKQKILDNFENTIASCTRCKLSSTRTKLVFGEGTACAKIMFIGEGPGKMEDLSGRPFVGRAGELLTRIIENGMKLKREEVYIANIVKCRPTVDMLMQKDRPPDKEEVERCNPYLKEQIKIIQPKIIITLGNPSTKFLLKTDTGITKLRGNWGNFQNIPVMPTYHPSFILRNGGEKSPLKRLVWEDIKKVLEKLNKP